MDISNGLLRGGTFHSGFGTGSKMAPRQLVFHYTAGSKLNDALLALKRRGLAYHLLVDRDGSVHQLRDLRVTAGHVGRSNWKEASGVTNFSSLNTRSIGISLVNLGLHDYLHQGHWWYSYDRKTKTYRRPSVPDEVATKASSLYAPERRQHWDTYTDLQIETCFRLAQLLCDEYGSIDEIVGHDDVAINDKFDPGPLFPLEDIKRTQNRPGDLGMRSLVNSPDGTLTLRDRPIHSGGRKIGTLHNGDTVFIRSLSYAHHTSEAVLVRPSDGRGVTAWASVDVDGSNRHAGFVSLRYVTNNPLAANYAKEL